MLAPAEKVTNLKLALSSRMWGLEGGEIQMLPFVTPTDLRGLAEARIAMMATATSAGVRGLPSWNAAFLRRCSVNDSSSGARDQGSAR